MNNVIVSTYATLDGRADDLPEWTLPYNGDAAAAYHDRLLAGAGGLLLGRRTYEIFAMIWPPRAGELPYVDRINSMAKYVVSDGRPDLSWTNSHRLGGDLTRNVAELRERAGGDLVVYGGHSLIAALRERDLIDEYRVLLHPVLLGRGPSLLGEGAERADLVLAGSEVLTGGVVVLTYRPAR